MIWNGIVFLSGDDISVTSSPHTVDWCEWLCHPCVFGWNQQADWTVSISNDTELPHTTMTSCRHFSAPKRFSQWFSPQYGHDDDDDGGGTFETQFFFSRESQPPTLHEKYSKSLHLLILSPTCGIRSLRFFFALFAKKIKDKNFTRGIVVEVFYSDFSKLTKFNLCMLEKKNVSVELFSYVRMM